MELGFEERTGRGGWVKDYLPVNFRTEVGQDVQQTGRVSSAIYTEAIHSKRVPVIYLPTEPSICRFKPEITKDFTGIGMGVLLLGCSIVSGLRRASID